MNNLSKSLLATTVGLCLISAHNTAFAQNDDIAGTVFEAKFFEQYAPRTALDMISQVPGFQLDGGENKRGLGQGGANVLVNGERVTGKADVGSQLNRITATNVTRIEIVDGASLDIPGLSGQVANIITENKGVAGTWSWAPEWRARQAANLGHIHLTVSGERGNLTYALEFRNESQRNGLFGPETLADAEGDIFETRDENARFYNEYPGVIVDLTWKPKPGHTGTLNAEYNQFNRNNEETSLRRALTPRGENINTLFQSAEDEWNATLGLDYEFPLGPGNLKTTAYYRGEHSPLISRFDVFDLSGQQIDGSRFFRTADEGEGILRTEYGWSGKEGQDWQVAAEGVFNFLDIEDNFVAFDGTLFDEQPPAEPTSTQRVEEIRTEVTATHSRPLSKKWDIQLSAGAEYSEISQQNGSSRDYFRPKGFVLATYKPKDKTNIRFRIAREVGQLNFFDFLAVPDLVNGQDRAGNTGLVPQQSWDASVEYDKDFGNGLTFKANVYGSLISDIVDRIPIGDDGDAVGNIDNANQFGIDLDATIKGDNWGFKGTQLDFELDFRDSNVDDPLLGFSRRLNFDKRVFWLARFRHDIPNTDWAYGAQANEYTDAPSFRLNTIEDATFDGPFVRTFVEHKDIFGMKVVVTLLNLLDGVEEYERLVFDGRRDQADFSFREFQRREFDLFLNIEFSGTF
jgi:hypothetical protein